MLFLLPSVVSLLKLSPLSNRVFGGIRQLYASKHSSRKLVQSSITNYKPKNENQQKYVNALENHKIQICLGVGPTGTGKTLFACRSAIQGYEKGLYSKIILTRPVVSVEDEEIGFLPGNLNTKMDPWVCPIMDIFMEYNYSQNDINKMIKWVI